MKTKDIGTKRTAGQLKGDDWLVLSESTWEEGGRVTHSCGGTLLARKIEHPDINGANTYCELIPYCPNCETRPNLFDFLSDTERFFTVLQRACMPLPIVYHRQPKYKSTAAITEV